MYSSVKASKMGVSVHVSGDGEPLGVENRRCDVGDAARFQVGAALDAIAPQENRTVWGVAPGSAHQRITGQPEELLPQGQRLHAGGGHHNEDAVFGKANQLFSDDSIQELVVADDDVTVAASLFGGDVAVGLGHVVFEKVPFRALQPFESKSENLGAGSGRRRSMPGLGS